MSTTSITSNQSGATLFNTMSGYYDFGQNAAGNSNSLNLFGCRNAVNRGNYDYFKGKIDDFRIYNRILTLAEIQNLNKLK